jgi:carboxyl-terminal processing protease
MTINKTSREPLIRRLRLLSIFSATFLVSSVVSAPVAQAGLQCRLIPPIMQGFISNHVTIHKADSELEDRTVAQFIKRLDPSKIYLFQSDVDDVRGKMKGIFNRMASGDCGAMKFAHDKLTQRVSESAAKAKEILGSKTFAFEPKTEIIIDPTKRDFPKNKDESEEQLRKFIQFQISNYLASDMKINQAKTQLIHRYELNVKRNKEMTEDDIYSMFLDSFASALDAHSSYLSKDVLEDFEISMRLSLEGIGTSLSWDDGYTVVESIIPGGAAERSGEIKPKDKIISVGQGKTGAMESVIDIPLRDVVKLIRGKKGSFVRLTILRQKGEGSSTFVVTLKRETINLKEDAAKLTWVDKEVQGKKLKLAIVDLPSFYGDMSQGSRSCFEDMFKLVEEARKKGADGMLLDLSKNGGGLLGEAVRIAGLFIRRGNVVATQDAKKNLDILADEDEAISYSGPLVVLTSRLSASASEIVAGALQDYKRALIVGGDKTFGKGTVQAVSNLPRDLGAIKVTTGMFFLPAGASTQHRGVVADISIPSPFSTKDIGEQALDHSLPARTVGAFLSKEVQPTDSAMRWKPIDQSEIDTLKSLSTARVEKNKDFDKVKEELAENEKKNGVIKLADALKKQKDRKDKGETGRKRRRGTAEDDEKYLEQAAVKEAIDILTDLIRLRTSGLAQDGAGTMAVKKN